MDDGVIRESPFQFRQDRLATKERTSQETVLLKSGSIALQITVDQFFDLYNTLFFQIPATGDVNSHEFLVKRSTEYLGGGVLTDNERAYIEEINTLRQQLLEANSNYLNLSNII